MRLSLLLSTSLIGWSIFVAGPRQQAFQVFLHKFNQDATFQKTHILFPLLVIHSAETTLSGKEERRYITENKWTFARLSKGKKTGDDFSVHQKRQDLYLVIFTREDTGIHIIHQFRHTAKGWRLELIRDEST